MELLIIWILFAVTSAIIASTKNRDVLGYAVLGLLIGPFAIIIAAVLPKRQPYLETEAGRLASGAAKKCPQCAELVQPEAKICRYCRHEFPAIVEYLNADGTPASRRNSTLNEMPFWMVVLLATLAVIVLSIILNWVQS